MYCGQYSIIERTIVLYSLSAVLVDILEVAGLSTLSLLIAFDAFVFRCLMCSDMFRVGLIMFPNNVSEGAKGISVPPNLILTSLLIATGRLRVAAISWVLPGFALSFQFSK